MINLEYYPLPKPTVETFYRLYFSGLLRHPNATAYVHRFPKEKPWRKFSKEIK